MCTWCHLSCLSFYRVAFVWEEFIHGLGIKSELMCRLQPCSKHKELVVKQVFLAWCWLFKTNSQSLAAPQTEILSGLLSSSANSILLRELRAAGAGVGITVVFGAHQLCSIFPLQIHPMSIHVPYELGYMGNGRSQRDFCFHLSVLKFYWSGLRFAARC